MLDQLTTRALTAYFRAGDNDQPAASSGVREHDGHLYVVLENIRGVLAVYRVRNDGALKRLRRVPAALTE